MAKREQPEPQQRCLAWDSHSSTELVLKKNITLGQELMVMSNSRHATESKTRLHKHAWENLI